MGNDGFRLAAGGTLHGTVSGGAGTEITTLELAGDPTLGTDLLRDFEIPGSEGSGTLTGTQAHRRVNAATNLTVASGARAGTDTILMWGGSAEQCRHVRG